MAEWCQKCGTYHDITTAGGCPDKEDKLWVGTYAEGFRAGVEAMRDAAKREVLIPGHDLRYQLDATAARLLA